MDTSNDNLTQCGASVPGLPLVLASEHRCAKPYGHNMAWLHSCGADGIEFVRGAVPEGAGAYPLHPHHVGDHRHCDPAQCPGPADTNPDRPTELLHALNPEAARRWFTAHMQDAPGADRWAELDRRLSTLEGAFTDHIDFLRAHPKGVALDAETFEADGPVAEALRLVGSVIMSVESSWPLAGGSRAETVLERLHRIRAHLVIASTKPPAPGAGVA